MATFKTIDQAELRGRRVFIRVDFNVPIEAGSVTDTSRIRAALPTIRHATEAGARVILASHLGRPKGKPDPKYTLEPVAEALASFLGKPVSFATDCVGPAAEAAVAELKDGDVVLLENLRYHAEEEANDPAFAKALASLCDVYVNDAFGSAHRAHASTAGIVEHVGIAVAGFLMKKELESLSFLLHSPAKPFVAIVGGAKVSDKIAVLESLLERVDVLLVGGAMAYTFLKAEGRAVGSSRVEDDRLETAAHLIESAKRKNVAFELPRDHVCAREFKAEAPPVVVESTDIPGGLMGLDIGPKTQRLYAQHVASAKTVFWNGPMGVFEWKPYAAGTMAIAAAVADSSARTVVGGGDSVAALEASGRSADIGHVSTGGGASLEFLEGRELPGVAALERKGG